MCIYTIKPYIILIFKKYLLLTLSLFLRLKTLINTKYPFSFIIYVFIYFVFVEAVSNHRTFSSNRGFLILKKFHSHKRFECISVSICNAITITAGMLKWIHTLTLHKLTNCLNILDPHINNNLSTIKPDNENVPKVFLSIEDRRI